MPEFWSDPYPSRELLRLRKAWVFHYINKGCSADKALWLAGKKTHTWPNEPQTGENSAGHHQQQRSYRHDASLQK